MEESAEWRRAVASGVEVGEITAHELAISRPRRGFESRWGHLNGPRDPLAPCAN